MADAIIDNGSPIVFRVSGGMFTPDSGLTVQADGAAVLESRSSAPLKFRVPRAAVDQLRVLLDRASFKTLARYYGPRRMTDVPSYEVSFGGHTVVSESGSPPAPAELWALIAQLSLIVDGARTPFELLVTLAEGREYLTVRINADDSAEEYRLVDSERRLSRSALDRLRNAAAAVDVDVLSPGLVLGSGMRPPYLELIRDFRAFHLGLDRPPPASAVPLVEAARAAAGPADR
jgi:hypothetical protein